MKMYIFNIVVLLLISTFSSAQTIVPPDLTPNKSVSFMERAGDVLYISGSFERVGFQTGGSAFILPDDTIPNLDFPYVEGDVYAIVNDGSGGWYVGGDFDRAGGINRSNIAHIFADYTIDPDFNLSFNNDINSLLLVDNVLYVGGKFTQVNSNAQKYVAAIDLTDNSLSTFDPQPNNQVRDMVAFENDLIIGGWFSAVGDSVARAISRISRVDGSVKSIPGAGVSAFVYDLYLDDHTLYVGGNLAGGVMGIDLQTNQLIDWSPVVYGFASSMNVNAITKMDTVIFIGGNFSKVNGIDRKNMAAIGVSGQLVDFAPEPQARVLALHHQQGNLYVGGEFLSIGNAPLKHIAKFDSNLQLDDDFRWNPTWSITSFCQSDENLLIGGEFDMLHAVEREDAYAIEISTGKLLDWAPQGGFLGVTRIKVDEARDIVYLSGYDSNTTRHVKAFHAQTGEVIPDFDFVFDNLVNTIDLDETTGNLYIAGNFSTINGLERTKMAAVDPLGNLLPFAPEIDFEVRELEVSEEHLGIYISGKFSTINNTPRDMLAFVDFNGNLGSWAPNVTSTSFDTYIKILPASNQIYLGGNFLTINGEERNNLGSVHPVSGDLLAWNPDAVTRRGIHIMEPFQNGIFVVGVDLEDIGGTTVNYLAYIGLQSGQVLENLPDFGFSDIASISTMVAMDSTLFVGGSFNFLQERFHPFIAKINFSYSSVGIENPLLDAVNTKSWPNPVTNNLHILMPGTYKEVLFSVTDMSGRIAKEIRVMNIQKNQTITLDLYDLKKGVYIIHWHADGHSGNSKILKK